jgi:hypothetical protein
MSLLHDDLRNEELLAILRHGLASSNILRKYLVPYQSPEFDLYHLAQGEIIVDHEQYMRSSGKSHPQASWY